MQKVYVLRCASFPRNTRQLAAEWLERWQVAMEPEFEERADGGLLVALTTSEAVQLQLRFEPKYRYPVVRLHGPDAPVARFARTVESDAWSHHELLLQVTKSDPPDASLLVPLALATEELNKIIVEILLRALEASSEESRRHALTAISLVPALAFAPALRVSEQRESDPALRAMTRRVLALCES